MHELPVTESLLEIAIRHATESDATRITNLHLVIGQLASIIDDSVQFYWDIISKGTIAEGASLHFKRIPTEFSCSDCDLLYHPENNDFKCPTCNGINVLIVAGREFYLESIEVDSNT
jgi:hydrogenase nickel incorporation protein HypA/HybF